MTWCICMLYHLSIIIVNLSCNKRTISKRTINKINVSDNMIITEVGITAQCFRQHDRY